MCSDRFDSLFKDADDLSGMTCGPSGRKTNVSLISYDIFGIKSQNTSMHLPKKKLFPSSDFVYFCCCCVLCMKPVNYRFSFMNRILHSSDLYNERLRGQQMRRRRLCMIWRYIAFKLFFSSPLLIRRTFCRTLSRIRLEKNINIKCINML